MNTIKSDRAFIESFNNACVGSPLSFSQSIIMDIDNELGVTLKVPVTITVNFGGPLSKTTHLILLHTPSYRTGVNQAFNQDNFQVVPITVIIDTEHRFSGDEVVLMTELFLDVVNADRSKFMQSIHVDPRAASYQQASCMQQMHHNYQNYGGVPQSGYQSTPFMQQMHSGTGQPNNNGFESAIGTIAMAVRVVPALTSTTSDQVQKGNMTAVMITYTLNDQLKVFSGIEQITDQDNR